MTAMSSAWRKPATGLAELAMPALVIWGERDPWLASSLGEAYARRAPERDARARGRRRPLAVAGSAGRDRSGRAVPGIDVSASELDWRRMRADRAIAAVLAIIYVIVSPPSFDLAAHLLRAKLFRAEGFGLWNNWWYAGHHTLGYSVLFPPISALLSPQLVAGLAATGTAALFELLVRRHFGPDAWLGRGLVRRGHGDESVHRSPRVRVRAAAGGGDDARAAAPASLGGHAARRHDRPRQSGRRPVRGARRGRLRRRLRTCGERRALRACGRESASWSGRWCRCCCSRSRSPRAAASRSRSATLWPIPLVAAGAGSLALPRREVDAPRRRAPVHARLHRRVRGLDADRQQRRPARRARRRTAGGAAVVAAPQAMAAARGVAARCTSSGRRRSATSTARRTTRRCAPLSTSRCSRSSNRQAGPPFRVEIPFTKFHWETYDVAPYFPLARGWERQLDIKYNHLFYDGSADARRPTSAWLHELAVRFVAVSDARLDFSADRETALIDRGLPYLHLGAAHADTGACTRSATRPRSSKGRRTLLALGPNSLTLDAQRAGTVLLRVTVHALLGDRSRARGASRPAGDFTKLTLRAPGNGAARDRLLVRPDPGALTTLHLITALGDGIRSAAARRRQSGASVGLSAAMRRRLRLIEARVLPRGWTDVFRQLLLFAAAPTCSTRWSRSIVGGNALAPGYKPFGDATKIINLERAAARVRRAEHPGVDAQRTHWLMDIADWTYLNAHYFVTIGALVFIYLRRNDSFYFVRNMFMIAMAIALVGYARVPDSAAAADAGVGLHRLDPPVHRASPSSTGRAARS